MIKPLSLGYLSESIDSDENVIISDSNLRGLLPPQVQLMSKQRMYLYGSEICTLATSLQYYLSAWRLRHIICLEQLA